MMTNRNANGRNIISGRVIFDEHYNVVSGDENFYRFVSPMLKKITDVIHQIDMDDFYEVVGNLTTYSTSTMVMRIRRFDNSFRWIIASLKQLNVTNGNDNVFFEMQFSDIINLQNHYTALTSSFDNKKTGISCSQTKKTEELLEEARKHHAQYMDDQLHFGILNIENFDVIVNKYGSEFGEKLKNDVVSQLYESLGDSKYIAHGDDNTVSFYVVNLGAEVNLRSFIEAFRNQVQWKYLSQDKRLDIDFSIGISEYPRNGKNLDEVIQKMYRAHELAVSKGHNRYIIYKEEIHGE